MTEAAWAWLRRAAVSLLAVGLVAPALSAAAPDPPEGAPPAGPEADLGGRFAMAENHFRYQDYEKAASLLRPLLYPKVLLTDRRQRLSAREFLAASYWWLKRLDDAREEFTALLYEDPNTKLDPFYYPAPLLAFYGSLRADLIARGVIKPGRKKPPAVIVHPPPPPWSVSLVPFGVPQFTYGHDTRGWLLLTGQSLSLLTNIGTAIAIEALRGPDGFFDQDDARVARKLRTTWWISGGIFVALYATGVIDGFVTRPHPPAPAAPRGAGGVGQSVDMAGSGME